MREKSEARAGSRRAVVAYTAILFAVVMFFIGLSYFIGERGQSSAEALHNENATAIRKIENLQEQNIQLQTENAELKATITRLEADISALTQSAQGEPDISETDNSESDINETEDSESKNSETAIPEQGETGQ
ncbi:MAG: hypothetical protein LBH17_02340 [Oscillospiraceae bacterium]|jgi:cell division protein FtsB|nr:hypothetical protein [Oscillospiraceae bacterium]